MAGTTRGAALTFSVRGVEALRNEIRKTQRRFEGRRGTLNAVGQFLAESFKQSFTKQADPSTGSSWAPLAPSTKMAKRRLGYSPRALIRTGQMKNSIGYQIVGTDRVYSGAADKKAIWHQTGTRGSGGRSGGGVIHIPARPIIGWNMGFEAKVKAFITKWIQGRRI